MRKRIQIGRGEQAMNTTSFGAAARQPAVMAADEAGLSDAAWIVLEAANDLGDDVTVDVCRRLIDGNLNGIQPSPSDLKVILNYFR
jgi:hypothetical protein